MLIPVVSRLNSQTGTCPNLECFYLSPAVCDLKGQAEENEEKIDTGHSRTSTELNVAQTMAKSPEGPFINARARSIIFNVQTTGFDKKYFPGDRL